MNLLKNMALFLNVIVDIIIASIGIIGGMFILILLIGFMVGIFMCFRRDKE